MSLPTLAPACILLKCCSVTVFTLMATIVKATADPQGRRRGARRAAGLFRVAFRDPRDPDLAGDAALTCRTG